jgi:hypothetical protein
MSARGGHYEVIDASEVCVHPIGRRAVEALQEYNAAKERLDQAERALEQAQRALSDTQVKVVAHTILTPADASLLARAGNDVYEYLCRAKDGVPKTRGLQLVMHVSLMTARAVADSLPEGHPRKAEILRLSGAAEIAL